MTSFPAGAPAPDADALEADILRHLTYTLGKDPAHAGLYDWRMALSAALRDRIVGPWFAATRRTWAENRKRVYYLSMEFLIMATLGCPGYGYGIRYEHGLFRQRFEDGRQVEAPEDWLTTRNPWEFDRPEVAYRIGFRGTAAERGGHMHWDPDETVIATAHDMPVIGWRGRWGNTLRLWSARATDQFDLARFNAGDHAAAAEPEALARTISRVLYPDDTTFSGKELRLKQEYFLTSAALQDILRRYLDSHDDLHRLPDHVAIQLNDTHPALAGPELIRLLTDEHGVAFDDALEIARRVLAYTNHTLLPEALERWATYLMGTVLPRHMQIIERIDSWHRRTWPARPHWVGIVKHHEVRMGDLAFVMAHKVNGVSALHTDLVRKNLFPELDRLHPGRIVNQTNGVTPRRWLRLANPALSRLITDTIGEGWEADADRLAELEDHVDDPAFRERFAAAKRANKERFSNWLVAQGLPAANPDALFDVQVKRIHEYKRQLLNVLQTVAHWHAIRQNPAAGWVPRIKIFGGKAAPGYHVAKEIVRLVNDVAKVVNTDPVTRDLLQVVYPPNYNVSMAERVIPAADLSEQISTAGKEASGTGNMKFALNGALTIGTLDGANVEIRERVGEDNFLLFGLNADEVVARRENPNHARDAILASQPLQDVLQMLAEGRFSPDEPDRYHGLVHNMWHSDYFLVASDFAAYETAQARADALFGDPSDWTRRAALNTARMGFFSSDRSIRGYMEEIWNVAPALPAPQATE